MSLRTCRTDLPCGRNESVAAQICACSMVPETGEASRFVAEAAVGLTGGAGTRTLRIAAGERSIAARCLFTPAHRRSPSRRSTSRTRTAYDCLPSLSSGVSSEWSKFSIACSTIHRSGSSRIRGVGCCRIRADCRSVSAKDLSDCLSPSCKRGS